MAPALFDSQTRAPADCSIKVGAAGQEITDLYPFLIEVTVETSRTEAATATLTFETRRDEQGTWVVQDAGILLPWEPIVIAAVFGERSEEVMRGYIRQVNTEYPENQGSAQVKVECQDTSLRLDRVQQRKTWGTTDAPVTDPQIVNQILSAYDGVTTASSLGTGQDGLININQNESDIQFLKKRAEVNGYELIFSEGQLYFGPLRLEADAQDSILVYAGPDTNCLSFRVSADGHLPDAIAYDIPDAQGSGTTSSDPIPPNLHRLGPTHADSNASGLENFVWKMSGEASADGASVQNLAQQKANEYDIQKVKAEGELDGTLYGHVLQVGLPVPVDGLGDWLSGTYYVDKVSHTFNDNGYKQRFNLLRNAFGDNLDSLPGGGVLGAVLGAL